MDLKFAALVTLVQGRDSIKLEVSIAFLFRENRGHGTGGQTDGLSITFQHRVNEMYVGSVTDWPRRSFFTNEMHSSLEDRCRMGCCSFCSLCDLSGCPFDEAVREKDFYIFVFSDLDL